MELSKEDALLWLKERLPWRSSSQGIPKIYYDTSQDLIARAHDLDQSDKAFVSKVLEKHSHYHANHLYGALKLGNNTHHHLWIKNDLTRRLLSDPDLAKACSIKSRDKTFIDDILTIAASIPGWERDNKGKLCYVDKKFFAAMEERGVCGRDLAYLLHDGAVMHFVPGKIGDPQIFHFREPLNTYFEQQFSQSQRNASMRAAEGINPHMEEMRLYATSVVQPAGEWCDRLSSPSVSKNLSDYIKTGRSRE